MKILHFCSFYSDGYNYQENILSRIHKADNHDVMIIASTEAYIDNKHLSSVEPRSYQNEDGIPVIRLPYKFIISAFLSKKIRGYEGLFSTVDAFGPDVIFFHGIQAYALRTICKYVSTHPTTKLYADCHSAYYNTAQNFLSKYLLHKCFYRAVILNCLPYIEKILCVTPETLRFSHEMYDVPLGKMELYPLGGICPQPDAREAVRHRIRNCLGMPDDGILFLHSGKLDAGKRTVELVRAFSKIESGRLRLAIIGSMTEDVAAEAGQFLERDPRILYLGWKTGSELTEYLCACDLYIQPGSLSATLQNALCCGCAAAVYPHEDYVSMFGDILYYVKTEDDMAEVFSRVLKHPEEFESTRASCIRFAQEKLDYRNLARRIYA